MDELRCVWRQVRCLFEAPILDDYKWAKLPSIDADAFLLDLEDSVPLDQKPEARDRMLRAMSEPQILGAARTVVRINHLSSPWGRDDLLAAAQAGIDVVMYPKTDTAEDVEEVAQALFDAGSSARVLVTIETARGVIEVDRIMAMPQVVAAAFGPGDLQVDAGLPLYGPGEKANDALLYPKVRCALAGAAFGAAVFGIAYTPNIKDLAEVRRRIETEKRCGFTGVVCFYPPHVELINEIFTPSEAELARASDIIERYEAGVRAGHAAVQSPSGEAILVHQYKEALETLARRR
jgi:citrate lyase beta subunit